MTTVSSLFTLLLVSRVDFIKSDELLSARCHAKCLHELELHTNVSFYFLKKNLKFCLK